MTFLPFRIAITDRAIVDLHRRLDATRWPEIPFESGWSTGTSGAVLRDLVTEDLADQVRHGPRHGP